MSRKQKSNAVKPASELPAANETAAIEPSQDSATEATEPRKWGSSFKARRTNALFDMGDDLRFKQCVFKFKEKPSQDVLAKLKESGFTYRANEKSWTIPASLAARELANNLADEFAAIQTGMSR